MAAHNDFGSYAEHLAAALLERNGWTILHRNWRFGRREIDLVARRGAVVAFVEVKARSRVTHGHPLDSIDWRKRRDVGIAAAGWIERHGRRGDEYRFDAVHVVVRRQRGRSPAADGPPGPCRQPAADVCHLENAWSL